MALVRDIECVAARRQIVALVVMRVKLLMAPGLALRLFAPFAISLSLSAYAAPLANVTSIAAGSGEYTCALRTGGSVMCWGSNFSEVMGGDRFSPQPGPVDIPGLGSGVRSIAAGAYHVCVVTSAGAAQCMGLNSFGELGDGTTIDRNAPTDVSGLGSGVAAITAGDWHSCALTVAGGAKCWGWTAFGGIGDGDSSGSYRLTPSDVVGLTSGAIAIAAGNNYTCALLGSGGVKCWGYNGEGQLGDGTTTYRDVPVDVAGLTSGVVAIAVGGDYTCALTSAGGVKCWGGVPRPPPPPAGTSAPQQGAPALSSSAPWASLTPVDIPGLSSGVVAISAGWSYACALLAGGGVKCWGDNFYGQLGDGTTTSRDVPVDVVGLPGEAIGITTGGMHACAALANGEAMCWGDDFSGQLGIGYADNAAHPVPATVGLFVPQTISFAAIPGHDVNEPPFAVSATASSGLPVTFASTTPSTCTASGTTVTIVANGICTIAANQAGDIDYYPAQAVHSFLVTGSPSSAPPRLANLSTLTRVDAREGATIGGFVVQGSTTKTVVVRALGPSLAALGVSDPLANPRLQVVQLGSTDIWGWVNDDWQAATASAPMLQEIGLAPSDPAESAMILTLEPGAYTAVVTGSGGTSGTALLEVYEIDHLETPLINASTRGNVGAGNDVMIGGFVLQGTTPQKVVVRAIGPSLSRYGVAGALSNPMLQLVRMADGATIATSDNWVNAANTTQIWSTGLGPLDSYESAILITLEPGAYTAIVSGVGGATGAGMVEVYAVP